MWDVPHNLLLGCQNKKFNIVGATKDPQAVSFEYCHDFEMERNNMRMNRGAQRPCNAFKLRGLETERDCQKSCGKWSEMNSLHVKTLACSILLVGQEVRFSILKHGFDPRIEYHQFCAVSLKDRTCGYGPQGMGSIPVLRAISAFNSAGQSNCLLSSKSLVRIQ